MALLIYDATTPDRQRKTLRFTRTPVVIRLRHRERRALSYQFLAAGTSVGSNYEESDGASSAADFIAKNRIALKEAKESRFRLRVCRRCNFLDTSFDSLVTESDEIVRILGKIVHNAARNKAAREQG